MTDVPGQVISERTHLFVPSLTRWIQPTVEYLKHKATLIGACQESRSGKLMVALHEALSNSIIHGNLELSSDLKERGDATFADALSQCEADPRLAGRIVDILVDFDGERCRWILTDQGRGFDIQTVLERCLSDDPEILLASGRGILLMRSFLDEVKYELGGRRVILTLNRVSGEEKRGDPRLAWHQALQVAPILPEGTVDWDAAYEAVSRNFSEKGMALIQEGLTHSDRILIGLTTSTQTVYIPAEVRHVRTLSGEIVELGCCFQTRLELGSAVPAPALAEDANQLEVHQAIMNLLEKQTHPTRPTEERRFCPRIVYNERIEIWTDASETPLVGFGQDLSKGGIAFLTMQPLPAEITLVLTPGAGGTPVRVRTQVIHCTKVKEGFFDVGARFLKLEGGKPGKEA
jgi:anti-sigma regulatory factor (Ser/Thr protein kinase)